MAIKKVKQLADQPPTLKTLLQKILVGLSVKNFTFSVFTTLKLKFSTTAFDTTFLYNSKFCTVVSKADTSSTRKIAKNC